MSSRLKLRPRLLRFGVPLLTGALLLGSMIVGSSAEGVTASVAPQALGAMPFFNPLKGPDADPYAIVNEETRLVNAAPPGSSIDLTVEKFVVIDAASTQVPQPQVPQLVALVQALSSAAVDDNDMVRVVVNSDNSTRGAFSKTGYVATTLKAAFASAHNGSMLHPCEQPPLSPTETSGSCLMNRGGIMHNKFLLISTPASPTTPQKTTVFVSSSNLNQQAAEGEHQNALRLTGYTDVYRQYSGYFDALFTQTLPDGVRSGYTLDSDHLDNVDESPNLVHVPKTFFFPRQGTVMDPVVDALEQVNCNNNPDDVALKGPKLTHIYIAMWHFTGRPELVDELSNLADQGCVIEITGAFIDDSIWAQLNAHKVTLQQDCGPRGAVEQFVHSKYMLISGRITTSNIGPGTKTVFTGSENYTNSALTNNDENMLRYTEADSNSPVFDKYLDDFDALPVLKVDPLHTADCNKLPA